MSTKNLQCSLKEGRNKNPISEPSELFLAPTTVQLWAVITFCFYLCLYHCYRNMPNSHFSYC
jgi:hypothetical protein